MNILSRLIDPFQPAKGPPPRTLRAFFGWALTGSYGAITIGTVFSVMAGVLEVVTAFILGAVIDGALASGTDGYFAENLWLLIGAAIFFIGIRPLIFGLSSALNAITIGPNVNPMVLARLHRWSLGQSVRFFDDDFAGRIAQKQMQTARAVTDVVVETVNVVAFALASLIGSALLLTTIDWRVALGLAVWLAGYFAVIRFFLPRIRTRSKARAGARAMVTGQVVDTITNIKTVKLFAHADHEDRAALDAMGVFREKALSFGIMATALRTSLMTLAGTLPVLLVGATLWLWTQGLATPGDVAATGAISIRIAQMTGWVSHTLMAIYASVGEVEDGMNTLTPAHDLLDKPDATDLVVTRGEVRFDHVTFSYGGGAGGVRDVSLTVRPGEKLGLVGASGAGKSTLVTLLLRLHDAERGAVLIDGQDVRDVSQESLRRKIGMVTQETAMFNRSARENILYGKPDASLDEVVAAARKAEADDFIQDLNDFAGRGAYEAHLGERGVKLSGGQRQRIALARAMLKDAPILVLDEATSALDSEVEASIQEALEVAMRGKTVIAIAHRLSTIASMDRIVVLDAGRIVEEGTHDDLLAQNGLYARYWNRQSGGFIRTQDAAE